MTRASRFYPVMISGEVNSSTVDESDSLRKCHVTHSGRYLSIKSQTFVKRSVLCCPTKLDTFLGDS